MTSTALWTSVDQYFESKLDLNDDALDAALALSATEGLPPIAVTATQGRFLQQLAHLTHARRILEIGTLGGYSTIWLARALPADGRVVTLEINAHHADVARRNLEFAGVALQVEIIVAPAAQSLERLIATKAEFDLIFIDADKSSSDIYFKAALALARKGSVIVVDNVVRDGAVTDETNADPNLVGIRRMLDTVRNEPRVSATAIQTVGSKGYDGLLVALVRS